MGQRGHDLTDKSSGMSQVAGIQSTVRVRPVSAQRINGCEVRRLVNFQLLVQPLKIRDVLARQAQLCIDSIAEVLEDVDIGGQVGEVKTTVVLIQVVCDPGNCIFISEDERAIADPEKALPDSGHGALKGVSVNRVKRGGSDLRNLVEDD